MICENLRQIQGKIAAIARHCGRDPREIELLAVSKRMTAEQIGEAYRCGQHLFGENFVQEAIEKIPRLDPVLRWHFIGHLQSNKVRQILPLVRLIHSVDSLSAVAEIDRHTPGQTTTNVLLQVNIGQEAGKYGIIPSEVDRFLEEAAKYLKVNFTGLMTMPPLADPKVVKPFFTAVRRLASELSQKWNGRYLFHHLSMGTSRDFSVAVEEGATIVRVGSIVFGTEGIGSPG